MTDSDSVRTSYMVHNEPTHVNAPDAWMVLRDGKMIAHGIPLTEALEEIRMDYMQ